MYFDAFVFLPLQIYGRHLSLPIPKMCLILDVPMGKNILFLSNKMFQVIIFENIHIT